MRLLHSVVGQAAAHSLIPFAVGGVLTAAMPATQPQRRLEQSFAAHLKSREGQGPTDSPLLDSLLNSHRLLRKIAQDPRYQLQLIYTQINRDAQNRPTFTPHTYHLDEKRYFNPASLVKLPVALLTLEKLNDIGKDKGLVMVTGAAGPCQTPVPFAAPPDTNRWATPANYIKRMLLVSDNGAYNRLYEFLGQKPLNDRLQQLGYTGSRIVRRFAPCDTAANRTTNPVALLTGNGDTVYKQPVFTNPRTPPPPLGRVAVGVAYRAGGRLVRRPYDFTTANNLPLSDVTTLLQTVLFPESIAAARRPRLTAADYVFLCRYLSLSPQASGFSPYASARYFHAYKKYLYYGRLPEASLQPGLRIYNIVGMSHGYLADVAYFADSLHRSEFMLSAVVYVNQDDVLNDGTYEYDSLGLPFLAQLGRSLYDYEASRYRLYRPNLPQFSAADVVR